MILGASAGALEHPLIGGGTARLQRGQSPAAVVSISADAALSTLPDPRCPAASSVRLVTSAQPLREIELDCRKWRSTAQGYRYLDPSGTAGGVEKIVVTRGRLSMHFAGGAAHVAADSIPFVEAALTVGADSYCGRFSSAARRRAGALVAAGPSERCRLPRPNFIVIVLDDVRADGVDRMPTLLDRLAAAGVAFDNAFTPNASCTPSRASLLTGNYSLRHRTVQVAGTMGGARRFRELQMDQQTIAAWLQNAGYRTGLFGKYLNAYSGNEARSGPDGTFYIPPGWSRWWAFVSPEHYGGVHGTSYEVVDETGALSNYDDHTSDAQYSTDLSAKHLRAFIEDSARRDAPFFAVWAPYAAHAELPDTLPAPAQRHEGAFRDIARWNPPNWDEADLRDKPRWLQAIAARRETNWEALLLPFMVQQNRKRQYETLLSVDEQLAQILDELARLGIDQDTLVLLTSDNGLGWGEHQMWGEKGCPYEECQRVPFIVRYPRRVPGGGRRVGAVALNIDVAPTLAALAGVTPPVATDGADLSGWLFDSPPAAWRSDYLLEHWRLEQADRLKYSGQVADGDQLRLFYEGTLVQPRQSLLFEFDTGDGVAPGAIAAPIGADADKSFTALARVMRKHLPAEAKVGVDSTRDILIAARPSSNEYWSLYFWKEVDRNGVMAPWDEMPNYLGVRDVGGGFTWVEYETGERELYDLNVDPLALENKADDPAYRATRERLEDRLKLMLREIRGRDSARLG